MFIYGGTYEKKNAYGTVYMDYFLLRYGIEDVGVYTRDKGVVSTYYGALETYKQNQVN